MTDTSNQTSVSIGSFENDEAATRLIDILCSVMHQCGFNDFDFDLLLTTAARRHKKQLIAEQIEERSLS